MKKMTIVLGLLAFLLVNIANAQTQPQQATEKKEVKQDAAKPMPAEKMHPAKAEHKQMGEKKEMKHDALKPMPVKKAEQKDMGEKKEAGEKKEMKEEKKPMQQGAN
jgi:hypothetical protein